MKIENMIIIGIIILVLSFCGQPDLHDSAVCRLADNEWYCINE